VRLFTPARHRTLFRDALLVDATRRVRPFVAAPDAPPDPLFASVLDRVVLMGRSLFDVADHTLCVYAGFLDERAVLAPTEPFREGVLATLRDALRDFGAVEEHPEAEAAETTLVPWLAYERGRVTVLDTPVMRPWLRLAVRHGLRVAAATRTDAPDPDVYVGGIPAPEYVTGPEEISLDAEFDA